MSASIEARIAEHAVIPIPPTIPTYDQAPLGHRAAMIRMRDDIPEEDMPPRRRFVLTAPPPGCDVAESSATAAARPPRGQYDFVDTVEAGQVFKNYFKTRQPHNQTQFLSTTDRSISNLFDTTLSMTTLADKSLLSGGDNKPPMLEKHLYDSWKSRMELYMMNRPHGRMILASVEKGPLVWPSITVDGVTRLKEYTELTPAEAIQADCDIKAINIILQGLPTEIYALVSQHRVAKDLWEKIKLLMQGTSLTKQERECKLYDEFDKFTYKKGESLHEYYLRFTLLLNDMNIYKMPLEQFQVNTKFLNTLPDEWSKFVTDVKLVKDLHTTNVDQLHAYLEQHERHANEVRLMHERNSDPLALVASHQITQSPYQTHQHTYQNTQLQPPASTYPSPQYGDDPIDAINHMMSFFTAVVTSRYPTTNNQLRNSSNLRQQATINNGRVTLQPIQGRQTSFAAGTSRTYTPGASGSNSRKQRTVICYNCKGEGHMSRQCTKPKRKRDDSWFKEKVLLDGPTPHPMITDPPPTDSAAVPAPRKKLDSEFSEEENKLEMADTQAEIILSQGLPRHIFNNLNQTSTAKEIWDNVEMLMQGSGRTIQQRKEDLFDEYERFRAIGK
ncbi:retrovirus-related pol polyprotein from transposon TNT 1-94 [Tanacetum coccineum]